MDTQDPIAAAVPPAAADAPGASGVAGQYASFAHLVAPNAERYRRVLQVFAAARDSYVVHLRPADVADELGAAPDEQLIGDLDRLAEWGNLRTIPDTSRVTSVEDFARRRQLYALTTEGEALEAALATYAESLGRRAELQTVALSDLRTDLRALLALADDPEPDVGRVTATLRDLETVFSGLADNAAAFMASLTRSIDTAADGVEAFLAYKDRLIGYLERFVGDLVVASGEIATLLTRLEDGGQVDGLLRLAARRTAADAAPGAQDDARDGVASELTPQDATDRALATWQARWQGLRRWFVGTPDHPAQAELLRARARAAIPDLLEAVTAIGARQAGRIDEIADWMTLARWFAEADDQDAHRLWRAAFGLSTSRHLTVDGETLDARREDPVSSSRSWADAPSVHVSARLRRTTRYQRRGPIRAGDRSASRRLLARALDVERAELDTARRLLATGAPLRLSELAVDAESFPVLLGLLGEALSASTGGVVHTTSGDGRLAITLAPTGDGRIAEVRTPYGVLRGHDHELTVTEIVTGAADHATADA